MGNKHVLKVVGFYGLISRQIDAIYVSDLVNGRNPETRGLIIHRLTLRGSQKSCIGELGVSQILVGKHILPPYLRSIMWVLTRVDRLFPDSLSGI